MRLAQWCRLHRFRSLTPVSDAAPAPAAAAARRAIERLAERDPRLRSALHTVLGELGDPDQRAAAARRAVAIIAEAAERDRR